MSRSSPTPTTTYPFTYTTYTTSLSSTSFTRPTLVPTLVPFGAAFSCSANAVATPQGTSAACAISNAREVNDHAFWDLYECCKGKEVTANGTPNPCTAQCVAGNGQTWQELGECLNKKVQVVVCKPADGEIARSSSGGAASQTSSGVGSATTGRPSGTASGSASGGQASAYIGAGSMVGVAHVGGSKTAVVVFCILAVGSFAGMLL
ncbi:hypothetical protein CC86DRAFT_135546 [Ophiobolus disseminans]|uniref:Uncharacterized protein n=1 Tax=Ophiobolus disseminans TaxID=1469910 RepID=A0A6A7AD29_9PLEO|nr:hypothetical protein CC86DRAFT_135546 [Ophiobolus disseminans]